MREPEAPGDVETSALMRHVVENRMQAVAERVRLQKLCASHAYGILADTWFEKMLSLPLESTAVVT